MRLKSHQLGHMERVALHTKTSLAMLMAPVPQFYLDQLQLTSSILLTLELQTPPIARTHTRFPRFLSHLSPSLATHGLPHWDLSTPCLAPLKPLLLALHFRVPPVSPYWLQPAPSVIAPLIGSSGAASQRLRARMTVSPTGTCAAVLALVLSHETRQLHSWVALRLQSR